MLLPPFQSAAFISSSCLIALAEAYGAAWLQVLRGLRALFLIAGSSLSPPSTERGFVDALYQRKFLLVFQPF